MPRSNPPLCAFQVLRSGLLLKCVSKAERIGLQIFIDVFFNQSIALKALRVRKDTQRGQAWAEPVHFIVCKSPMRHQRSYRSTATAMAERRRLTLIARQSRRRPLLQHSRSEAFECHRSSVRLASAASWPEAAIVRRRSRGRLRAGRGFSVNRCPTVIDLHLRN